jgi:opacity protein-like surface antigen
MKRISITLLFLILSGTSALFAQQSHHVGLTGRFVWVNPSQDQEFGTDGRLNFGGSTGVAIAADVPLGRRFSIEVEGASLPMELSIAPADGLGELDMGELTSTGVTAMARYHFFNRGNFSAYAGAGGTYLTMGDVESVALRNEEIDHITFDSTSGPVVGAGFNLGFWRMVFNVDAKYRTFSTDSRATFTDGEESEDVEIDVKPLTVGVGFGYRF